MTVEITKPGKDFQHGTVAAGDYTLDYAAAGPSDADVTIVSFPGSAGLEMSTAKDQLATKYRVVEINPPGWGGRGELTQKMTMGEIAAILSDAADQLIAGRYVLIGTSMGGINAIHAAAAAPERVQGIILEGSMAPALPDDLWFPEPPKVDPDAAPAEGYPLPPVNPKKPWADEDFIREQMANRARMFPWVELDMLPEDALAAVAANGTPVLALLGESDEIMKPDQQGSFAKYLPGSEFHIVPGGSHDIQNTAPEEFVALVETFVAEG